MSRTRKTIATNLIERIDDQLESLCRYSNELQQTNYTYQRRGSEIIFHNADKTLYHAANHLTASCMAGDSQITIDGKTYYQHSARQMMNGLTGNLMVTLPTALILQAGDETGKILADGLGYD